MADIWLHLRLLHQVGAAHSHLWTQHCDGVQAQKGSNAKPIPNTVLIIILSQVWEQRRRLRDKKKNFELPSKAAREETTAVVGENVKMNQIQKSSNTLTVPGSKSFRR